MDISILYHELYTSQIQIRLSNFCYEQRYYMYNKDHENREGVPLQILENG